MRQNFPGRKHRVTDQSVAHEKTLAVPSCSSGLLPGTVGFGGSHAEVLGDFCRLSCLFHQQSGQLPWLPKDRLWQELWQLESPPDQRLCLAPVAQQVIWVCSSAGRVLGPWEDQRGETSRAGVSMRAGTGAALSSHRSSPS